MTPTRWGVTAPLEALGVVEGKVMSVGCVTHGATSNSAKVLRVPKFGVVGE